MRIYVIGPVSGHDNLNLQAFESARKRLRGAGFIPLIPHDFVADDASWQQAMRRSLETLSKADGVAALAEWSTSHGATLECRIAKALGIRVATVDQWCKKGAAAAKAMSRDEKLCPKCGRVIPLLLFDKATIKADGKQAWCRDCMKSYKRGQS